MLKSMNNHYDAGVTRGAICLMLVLGLTACSQTKSFLANVRSPSSFGGDDAVLGAPQADDYLKELGAISIDDPAAQAEIYADAKAAAELTPNPSTRLRYALVLGTPGHPESDPAAAESLLRDVLTQTELLTEAEVALANIFLNAAEIQLVRDAEARQLRATSSQVARTQEAVLNDRLARVESENRRLRQELEESQKKLEAITSIERSIREQDNGDR